jgi:DNA repair photolyase
MINTECGKKKYQKRVFLITDGESKLFGADDINPIISGLNDSEIRVNMITLDFCNDIGVEARVGDEEMKEGEARRPREYFETQNQKINRKAMEKIVSQI